jgi:hypothetical protein
MPLDPVVQTEPEDAILSAAFAQAEYAIEILKNIVADGGPAAREAQADLASLAAQAAA